MADRLTQLQDAIDQLATIFYCALRYVGTHHDFAPTHNEPKVRDETLTPDPPALFRSSQQELARDLVLKTKQIEVLIASLPGIGVSEDDQKERLKELGRELERAEEERKESIREKEELLVQFDEVVRSLKRV
ncbi:RNA polymerase II mediator complex subunit [Arthrobotrys musiformis]|uniref:Mediator of RNA polymerase II transcription subunit 21 n=1 Tax=Arthrobotrys musiformis TaxID=47236 RepID=A0AAV9WGM1_9PEZI